MPLVVSSEETVENIVPFPAQRLVQYDELVEISQSTESLSLDSSPTSEPAPQSEILPSDLLLAEDNKINQKLALALLARLGYTVDLAENGVEAVAAASMKHYALIFMEMQMPEMDGLEATRQIRSLDGPNVRTPIVALTANAMQSDHDACGAVGMNDFLTKPISRDSLAACLVRWGMKGKSNQAV